MDVISLEAQAANPLTGSSGSAAPLIATKVQVPRRRPGLLARPRLMSFLHSRLDRKLILVSAPAGYGKTTLLAEFAADTDLPVCWYSLDPFDRDIRTFLEYLIAAIARQFPGFGGTSRAFLRGIADPGAHLYPIVATLVQEIYDTISEYFFLILDDHQAVESQESITEFLDLFLTYVDESCHLILASRTLPALPSLSLLVARRQAAGLSIDELRFTPEEIRALAEQNHGLGLNLEQAEILSRRTGGWITGLLLTAVPRWEQAQAEVSLRGRIGADLNDYLSKQVLDQQPAALRNFLLASSVLDELSPDLCAVVLESDQAATLIEQVRLRNLFVTPFGEEERLRYDDLFRGFLQSSLRRQDEAHFRALSRRAAAAYASRGEWERAVSRYLDLQEYAPVVEIIERAGNSLYDTGRWDTLAGWIDALPEAIRNERPQFLVLRGKIHGERGEYASALALWEQAGRAFDEVGDRTRMASVLAYKGGILRFQGFCSEAIAHSQRAIELCNGDTPLERSALAAARKNIGLCQISMGQLAEGRSALAEALRLYKALDDTYNLAMAEHDLGLSHERAGDLGEAIGHYQAALGSWERLGSPGPWANTLNGLGVVFYVQGRYEEALPILTEALAKAQKAGDPRVQSYTWASLGDLYRDLGAIRQAREAYAQALDVARSAHAPFIVTYALDGLGNTLRLEGDLTAARRHLLEAMKQAQANDSAYEMALCHTSLGILLGHEGNLPAARHHLDQAIQVFEQSGYIQELGRACLHRAYAAFQAGDQQDALVDLQRALDVAGQLGFDQFLVVEGQSLAPLLEYAVRQPGREGSLPDLVQRIESHRARIASQPEPSIETEHRGALKIFSLGQIRVEMDGQSVQWVVQQSRDLFYYLLQHSQGLRKEQIGQAFWPDHGSPKLDGVFRSTLYRLRRALYRQCVVFEDEVYRFNRSFDYWYDVEAFEALLVQPSASEAPEKTISRLEEALSLYQGDYLEGIYADWPVLERERLRQRYHAALETLAELYASGRNLRRGVELYRQLLRLDPYHEVVHRALMRTYQRLGDRAAAIRQYHACAGILREDLGISPAAETESLYLEIIG